MVSPEQLGNEAIATVRRWLAQSADVKPDASAQRLAGLLKDPRGLEFTIGFVDRVVRPEDLRVAGRNLERLSRHIPAFLPWYLRFAILLGGGRDEQWVVHRHGAGHGKRHHPLGHHPGDGDRADRGED